MNETPETPEGSAEDLVRARRRAVRAAWLAVFVWLGLPFLFMLSLFGPVVLKKPWMSLSRCKVETAGAPILAAIQAYHTDQGVWPDDLERLVPKHLAEIPPAPWGNGCWDYEILSSKPPGEFELGIYEEYQSSAGILYHSARDEWFVSVDD